MTDAEKIAMVQTLVENDTAATDSVVSVYLNLARNTMLERLYPLDKTKTVTDIPARYDTLQCELAARYYLRRGGQGEISHGENGITRSYASVDDADILDRLTPFVKVGVATNAES
ncbi:MAG: phage head-tail connector protein [Treponema sp.]|nr:phage head-tail connector protein [Treponema sp.]